MNMYSIRYGLMANRDSKKVSSRVGPDYQAVCPDLQSRANHQFAQDKTLLVWSPYHSITDNALNNYIAHAKEAYEYNIEQALGLLFWHQFDIELARLDLSIYTKMPSTLTDLEKGVFEKAFDKYGKAFRWIQELLPNKSIKTLVEYYYSWKKVEPVDHAPNNLTHPVAPNEMLLVNGSATQNLVSDVIPKIVAHVECSSSDNYSFASSKSNVVRSNTPVAVLKATAADNKLIPKILKQPKARVEIAGLPSTVITNTRKVSRFLNKCDASKSVNEPSSTITVAQNRTVVSFKSSSPYVCAQPDALLITKDTPVDIDGFEGFNAAEKTSLFNMTKSNTLSPAASPARCIFADWRTDDKRPVDHGAKDFKLMLDTQTEDRVKNAYRENNRFRCSSNILRQHERKKKLMAKTKIEVVLNNCKEDGNSGTTEAGVGRPRLVRLRSSTLK